MHVIALLSGQSLQLFSCHFLWQSINQSFGWYIEGVCYGFSRLFFVCLFVCYLLGICTVLAQYFNVHFKRFFSFSVLLITRFVCVWFGCRTQNAAGFGANCIAGRLHFLCHTQLFLFFLMLFGECARPAISPSAMYVCVWCVQNTSQFDGFLITAVRTTSTEHSPLIHCGADKLINTTRICWFCDKSRT